MTPLYGEGYCSYQTADGVLKVVANLKAVPEEYKSHATCIVVPPKKAPVLARPTEIRLFGNVRKEDMASPLGRIDLRWPRKVEDLFGKTPVRAVADAFRTASRALKHGSFPTHLRSLDIQWNIIFLDEKLPTTQIPQFLVSNCHPAWMTAPSNIYVVAQRVAVGCEKGKEHRKTVADAELVRVMLHEIGHAIEFQLYGPGLPRERFRSEGFAAWFEAYAADFSSKVATGVIKKKQLRVAHAVHSSLRGAYIFNGRGSDYAYASSYFHFVVSKRNIAGLMDVYSHIDTRKNSFLGSVDREFAWNPKRRAQLFDDYLQRQLRD